MTFEHVPVRLRRLLPVLLPFLLLAACAADETATPAPDEPDVAEIEAEEAGEPDVYTMRGEIVVVPDAGAPDPSLTIRHEAVDDFKAITGEIWGMDSMTMPFPIADDVSLDGLEAGDKVGFTLEVDHYGDVPMRVTAIEELPADTELVFGTAQPPPGDDAAGDEGGGGGTGG